MGKPRRLNPMSLSEKMNKMVPTKKIPAVLVNSVLMKNAKKK
jgi:hypothetical protein